MTTNFASFEFEGKQAFISVFGNTLWVQFDFYNRPIKDWVMFPGLQLKAYEVACENFMGGYLRSEFEQGECNRWKQRAEYAEQMHEALTLELIGWLREYGSEELAHDL